MSAHCDRALLDCASVRPGFTGPRRARPVAGTLAGFTLVELMVALALAAVISMSIMFISSQARQAYEETAKKVDAVSRLRYGIQSVERDIQNWQETSDLEFYNDGKGRGELNGHWDEGEEIADRTDMYGPNVVDGGVLGRYDEFPSIVQMQYSSIEPGQSEEKYHDAYQMYFRSLTYVDGAVRLANVEYMLVDPSQMEGDGAGAGGRSRIPLPPTRVKKENVVDLALYKIVRYYDINAKMLQTVNETPVTRRVIEVCSNLTDFRVEYMVQRDAAGRVESGFRTPEEEYRSFGEAVLRPKKDPNLGVNGGYRKSFGYGSSYLQANYPRGIAMPARRGDEGLWGLQDHSPLRFGFQGNPDIFFGELVPGNKIFVFTEADRGIVGQGAMGPGGSVNVNRMMNFPSRDYTVRANNRGLLEFEEEIDTVEWGGKDKSNLYYKAGFLPTAVRITLRMVDDKGENPKTMQREIWLRRRSK